jgi:hypothetical protein
MFQVSYSLPFPMKNIFNFNIKINTTGYNNNAY